MSELRTHKYILHCKRSFECTSMQLIVYHFRSQISKRFGIAMDIYLTRRLSLERFTFTLYPAQILSHIDPMSGRRVVELTMDILNRDAMYRV